MIARDTCPHCGASVPVPTLEHRRTDGYHVRTVCRSCRQPLLFSAVLRPGTLRVTRYQLDRPERHAPGAAAGLVYVAAPDQDAAQPPLEPSTASMGRQAKHRQHKAQKGEEQRTMSDDHDASDDERTRLC